MIIIKENNYFIFFKFAFYILIRVHREKIIKNHLFFHHFRLNPTNQSFPLALIYYYYVNYFFKYYFINYFFINYYFFPKNTTNCRNNIRFQKSENQFEILTGHNFCDFHILPFFYKNK